MCFFYSVSLSMLTILNGDADCLIQSLKYLNKIRDCCLVL